MSLTWKAVIAGLLFITIQFVSMVGGIYYIASAQDFDNIDDLSLEDVVPLDPFLSGTGHAGTLVGLNVSVKAVFALLHLLLPQPAVKSQAVITPWIAASGIDSRGHNLWLFKRVLLI